MLILASGSPRRIELLKQIGLKFSVVVPEVDENINTEKTPEETVMEIAHRKAEKVFKDNEDSIVISADTIVYFEDKILGKPKDKADAKNTLRNLSGNWHRVYTGVCIFSKNSKIEFVEVTDVKFRVLTDWEIDYYVNSGKPLDKAGSYGIQEFGAVFVERIEGDYFNVMGLPVSSLWSNLSKIAKLEEFMI